MVERYEVLLRSGQVVVTREDFRREFEDFETEVLLEVALLIAVRACLRVIPDAAPHKLKGPQHKLELLRMALTLHVTNLIDDSRLGSAMKSGAASLAKRPQLGPSNDMLNAVAMVARSRKRAALWGIVAGTVLWPDERLESAKMDKSLVLSGLDREFPALRAEFLGTPLWASKPVGFDSRLAGFWGRTGSGEDVGPWAFWKRWYAAVVEGNGEIGLDILAEVAGLPESVWTKGPEAVAAEIERIEGQYGREQSANTNRAPEKEPADVRHLFEAPRVISAGSVSVAYSISQGFEAFRAETGLNETPDMLVPLEAVPQHLRRIADILRAGDRSQDVEQALREEIGRLNARIEDLTEKLAEANRQIGAQDGNSWKKVAAGTAIAWGVVGALATAVWTVSGDEVGARQRLETLQEYRDVFEELYGDPQVKEWCPEPGP